MNLLQRFLSAIDFGVNQAPEQKLRRPFGANTDCDKIFKALSKGQKMTILKAFILCGGATSADRRFREVRNYVRGLGITMQERWVRSKGNATIKEFWIDKADLQKLAQ